MSETSSPPKRARSQFSLNFLSVIQITLFLIVIIAANYLSCQRYERKDLTETRTYTLSSQTLRVLENDLFTKREEPVRIILAFRRGHPFTSRLKTVLEEYRRISGGKVDIEHVDPIRNPDRAEELSNLYRIQFTKDVIIVDARQGEDPLFKEVPATLPPDAPLDAEPENKTQLQLSSRVRFLEPEDVAKFSTNSATGRELEAWQDEDAITSAILSSIEGKVRKIYYLADKSDDSGPASPWKVLASALYFQNVALIPINLNEISEIPSDADGIALISPKYDLDLRELDIITNYWSQPRSSIFVVLNPGSRPDKLRTFLREHGVTLRNDRILTRENNETINTVRANFTVGPLVNKELGGKATSFDGSSSSLEVRENASDLVSKKISPIPLIQAGSSFWGETDYESADPTFDTTTDHSSPLFLGAAVIKGAATNDALADDISKMVILSTADFLNPKRIRDENLDFVTASANWLIGREDLIGISPKKITTRRMTFLTSEISFINKVTLFLMPAIALIIAAFVWNARRR